MTIDGIDVEATVKKVRELLAKEQSVSPALCSTLEVLLVVVQLLVNRLGLNSRNSSKPPASDKNRSGEKRTMEGNRKAGGQPGSIGITLRQVDDPDEIEVLVIDRRQVFDIDISRIVTEYQAEALVDENGQRYVAPFPDHVTYAHCAALNCTCGREYAQFKTILRSNFSNWCKIQINLIK